jgi:hypothetical protein
MSERSGESQPENGGPNARARDGRSISVEALSDDFLAAVESVRANKDLIHTMKTLGSRRDFLKATSIAAASESVFSRVSAQGHDANKPNRQDPSRPTKVVVWDEQQPAQKQAYPHFLGNQIAEHLAAQPGISVRSVNIDEPGHGLAAGVLDDCNVLIWWGHVRHAEIAPQVGQSIVQKIKAGRLSLVALHSAHLRGFRGSLRSLKPKCTTNPFTYPSRTT